MLRTSQDGRTWSKQLAQVRKLFSCDVRDWFSSMKRVGSEKPWVTRKAFFAAKKLLDNTLQHQSMHVRPAPPALQPPDPGLPFTT